jgi:signal transduction histidine kinase
VLSGVQDRLARVDHRSVDALLATAVLLAVELTCWLSSGTSHSERIVTAAAAVLFAAPIAVRRVWPSAALVFSVAVVTVSMLFGSQLLTNDNAYVLPVLVLSYSAGAGLDTRRSVIALGIGLVLLCAWALWPGPNGSPEGLGQSAWALFYVAVLLIPTWLVGRLTRRHTRRTSAFRELAELAAADQHTWDAAAIADERARIGNELQDIIAHSISAMVIQAGSARLILRSDPDRARDSILNVERTGRQALSDLRRLLGMLRKDDDPRALSPQPGLSQITALIESVRQTGLTCERSTVGDPINLTPGIDLVAYRVVEMGLQAAADGRVGHSLVTIRYEPRGLELEIRGDRVIPDLDRVLAPLVQRVALYQGELRTQPTAEGFAVRARLPLDAGTLV